MLKIGNSDISHAFLGTDNIVAAYLGEIQIFSLEDFHSQYLTFEAAADNCQIKFYAVSSSNIKTILVSTDKNTWTAKTSSTSGTVLATLNSGLKLYVKGNNSAYSNNNALSNSILPTANCYVYGNVMSLIDDSNFKTLTTISTSYAFRDLFNSSRYSFSIDSKFILTKSGKNIILPATTLADGCYCYMFYNCSSLTSAPELPATTLANYCYWLMFYNCSSLTSAPELPATTLADGCYWLMFDHCISLTSAPELPATTLANNCYNYMFYNCSSLTSAPKLPATTLANNCYNYMFYNCSSLSYIKCLATAGINENNSTASWVSGVASTGTFIKDPNATWPTGNNGIPSGWIVQPVA